jgi:hypothetical protein
MRSKSRRSLASSLSLVLGSLVLGAWLPALAQERPASDREEVAVLHASPTFPSSEDAPKVLTGKERLSGKWMDEQRVDNCKVPFDKRGIKPRPDACPSTARN